MRGKTGRKISGQIALYALAILGGVVMFATLQRQLIYFPQVEPEGHLLRTASRIGLLDWRDRRGELIGWRTAHAGKNARRLVVFHGNAGYAMHRTYYAAGFLALDSDWEVYLFEYPGYGARPGKPSEDGIKKAAVEALESLLEADPAPVFLVGESLGSGVAAYLAARFPAQVGGMLLVTPFTSLADVAAHHYGMLPVRALLTERYDARDALGHYRGPVAFLLAGSDEIVPVDLGRQLYDDYPGPKWLRVEPGAGHNSLSFNPGDGWWREVEALLTAR
jgi:pimeloyl-ACP methyl ester carboxylesterase